MNKTEEIVKIVNAIGSQWPFLIVLFSIIVILIKWKSIWKSVENFKKVTFKHGDTQLELITEKKEDLRVEAKDIQKTKEQELTKEETQELTSIFDVYSLLSKGNIPEAEELFNNIQEKTPLDEKFENYVHFLYYKFLNGISNVIDNFNDLLNRDNLSISDKYLVYYFLGFCFKHIKNKEKSILAFSKALEFTTDEVKRIDCACHIAQSHLFTSDFDSAINILHEHISKCNLDKAKSKLYKELSDIYKEKKENILQISCLEKAVELAVNDISILFDLAYAYSQTEFEEGSIYHYLTLLGFKGDHPMALNNLGVSYKKMELPILAVNYYKQAVEQKNTLAAGNLAYLYLQAGCTDEVLNLIEKFRFEKDIDQMLINAHRSLMEAKKSENERGLELKADGEKLSTFFRDYANSCFDLRIPNDYFDDNWRDDENNLISVSIINTEVKICWQKKNEIMNDCDNYLISGVLSKLGCKIKYEIPRVISPGFLSNIYFKDKPDKPYREFDKFNGYCSLNIKKGLINIMYIKDKNVNYKRITKPLH